MAREIQGGDGILIKNHAMKSLLDAEGIYTYEGTYEINTLVAGREILGLSAVK
jgi:alkylation response protein AidB-like acyl-CoA dehydrogenase